MEILSRFFQNNLINSVFEQLIKKIFLYWSFLIAKKYSWGNPRLHSLNVLCLHIIIVIFETAEDCSFAFGNLEESERKQLGAIHPSLLIADRLRLQCLRCDRQRIKICSHGRPITRDLSSFIVQRWGTISYVVVSELRLSITSYFSQSSCLYYHI